MDAAHHEETTVHTETAYQLAQQHRADYVETAARSRLARLTARKPKPEPPAPRKPVLRYA